MALTVTPCRGAGLKQVEQGAMLEKQLLNPEGQRALGGEPVDAAIDDRHHVEPVGQSANRDFHSDPIGNAVEHGADRRPVGHEGTGRAEGDAVALRAGKGLERMALSDPSSGIIWALVPGVEGRGPTEAVRRTRNNRSRSNASAAWPSQSRTAPGGQWSSASWRIPG